MSALEGGRFCWHVTANTKVVYIDRFLAMRRMKPWCWVFCVILTLGCARIEHETPWPIEGTLQPGEVIESLRLIAEVENVSPKRLLKIVLKNISPKAHTFAVATNFFEGHVHLRNGDGQVVEFTQRRCFEMQMKGFYSRPIVQLSTGSSIEFEISLSDFIDPRRGVALNDKTMPNLEDEFVQGCTIEATLPIFQWKPMAKRSAFYEVGTVHSVEIKGL